MCSNLKEFGGRILKCMLFQYDCLPGVIHAWLHHSPSDQQCSETVCSGLGHICTTLQSFCCGVSSQNFIGRFRLVCIASRCLRACCSRDLRCICKDDCGSPHMCTAPKCTFCFLQCVLQYCSGFHWHNLTHGLLHPC